MTKHISGLCSILLFIVLHNQQTHPIPYRESTLKRNAYTFIYENKYIRSINLLRRSFIYQCEIHKHELIYMYILTRLQRCR